MIHCITNYVTVNDCANVLHAIGASPVMAHDIHEVEEVTRAADALVLNLGATEYFPAMKLAAGTAVKYNIPIIVDPVGAGGIAYRRDLFNQLIELAPITCLRGNASEIRGLFENRNTSAGVDSAEESDSKMEQIVKRLAQKLNTIIVASGAVDFISDGKEVLKIEEGTPMFTHITGAGCMSTALIGGAIGKAKGINSLSVVAQACRIMGQCGMKAEEYTLNNKGGIMTFRHRLIDELSIFYLSQ